VAEINEIPETVVTLNSKQERRIICKHLSVHWGTLLQNLKLKDGLGHTMLRYRLAGTTPDKTPQIAVSTFDKMIGGRYLTPEVLLKIQKHQHSVSDELLSEVQRKELLLDYFFEQSFGIPYAEYKRLDPDVLRKTELTHPAELAIPELGWNPDIHPPTGLLRPESSPVPFHGRDKELENFNSWLGEESLILIRLYSGPGGVGKTRWGLEICRQTRKRADWWAGFLTENISRNRWSELSASGKNLLVVIDYADYNYKSVINLVQQTIARTTQPAKVRIILLARSSWEWWSNLAQGAVDAPLSPLNTSAQALFQNGNILTERELGPLVVDRNESYTLAVEAFANALQLDVISFKNDDLSHPDFARVLLLQMKALSRVEASNPEGEQIQGKNTLLKWVLDRERRHWLRQLEARQLSREFVDGIAQAMAAITLVSGVKTVTDGLAVLKGLSFFCGQPTMVLRSIVNLMHSCYPTRDAWIGPLLPDLVGEFLVLQYFHDPATMEEIRRIAT